MALTQTSEVDRVEVVGAHRSVQVREAIIVRDGDAEIARNFHRHIIHPGDDYSSEIPLVQAVCEAAHTAEVIAAYQASLNGEA
jgi:hypothetical protein